MARVVRVTPLSPATLAAGGTPSSRSQSPVSRRGPGRGTSTDGGPGHALDAGISMEEIGSEDRRRRKQSTSRSRQRASKDNDDDDNEGDQGGEEKRGSQDALLPSPSAHSRRGRNVSVQSLSASALRSARRAMPPSKINPGGEEGADAEEPRWLRVLGVVAQIGFRRYKNQQRADRHRPRFLVLISAVQAVILLCSLIVGGFDSPSNNPMLGPPALTLVTFGGNVPTVVRGDFAHEGWRVVVPIFLHAGLVHILANVYTQISVGMTLERFWGSWRLIAVYFLSSIGGNITTALLQGRVIVSIGASGGVMGLIGALMAELAKNWADLWHPRAQFFYWAFNALVFLATGLAPSMDNLVHSGGFLVGFLAGLVFVPFFRPPSPTKALAFWTIGGAGLLVYLAGGLALLHRGTFIDCPVCCHLCFTLHCQPY